MKEQGRLFSALDAAEHAASAASVALQNVRDNRAKLCSALDAAEGGVAYAALAVQNVHNNLGSYNEIVRVHCSKKNYLIGIVRLGTKRWSRDEVRFNQKRFDDDLARAKEELDQKRHQVELVKMDIRKLDGDLARASKELDQKRQQVELVKASIQTEINAGNDIITRHDQLETENQRLKLLVDTQKRELNVNCDLDNKTASLNSNKRSLEQKHQQNTHEVASLPNKIIESRNQLHSAQQEQARLEEQRDHACQQSSRSYQALHQKLAALDNCERAKLVFAAVSKGDQDLLSIVKSYGYWKEFTAYIAVQKNSLAVLDYCVSQGIDFDSFINEDVTLASSILKTGNAGFVNTLFSSSPDLKLTALSALYQGDIDQLQILCERDSHILSKIQDIDACGLSAAALAIAYGNVGAIEFIKNNQPECLSQQILGYKNIFEMAVTYNNPEVIQTISSCISEKEIDATVYAFLENNQVDMFERALKHTKFSQDKLYQLYKDATSTHSLTIALQILDLVEDPRALFSSIVGSHNLEAALELIASRESDINLDYISDLIGRVDSHSDEFSFLSNLYDMSSQYTQEDMSVMGEYQDQSQMAI